MANRYRYLGESPGILRENDNWKNFHFEFALEPGDEFDAPEGWRPEPYPHPVYLHLSAAMQPVVVVPEPPSESSPQESEKA